MTWFILIKYVHFLGILLVFGALLYENIAIKPVLSTQELRRMAKIDGLYGGAVVLVISAGLLLWFVVGKPASFYSQSAYFMVKLVIFTAIGFLSIWPTVFFLKHRKSVDAETIIPKAIIRLIRAELILMLVLPLLAVAMANGL